MNNPKTLWMALLIPVFWTACNCNKIGGSSGDKVGIPECDDYLAKYEACLKSGVPAEARQGMTTGLKNMRDGLRQAAQSKEAKAGLTNGCKQSLKTTKEAMKAFNCKW